MIDGPGVQRTTSLEAGIAVAKQLRKVVSEGPLEKEMGQYRGRDLGGARGASRGHV